MRLVAVAETFPAEDVRRAAAAGAADVGETIEEAREKVEALADLGLRWHFIGHLQRNKAGQAVRLFDLIHTVDSARLGAEIDRAAGRMGKRQDVLVQVNVAGEATKSGCAPDEAAPLVRELSAMGAVRCAAS